MASTKGSGHFSLSERNPPGFKQNLTFFLLNTLLPFAMGILARFSPVFKMPRNGWVWITGFDAVQEVFSRQNDFEVPYEAQMEVLDWPYFLLATQDTPEYWDLHKHTMALWRAEDISLVRKITRETTEQILNTSNGHLDLIQDLAKPVLLAIVEKYYGVPVPEALTQPFFDGNLAGSGFVFSGPNISDASAEQAKDAVAEVWPVIDAALEQARISPPEGTVLGRYYSEGHDKNFPEIKMRSAIMAMIGGFLPTDTNATGRIMQLMLDNASARSITTQAAVSGDDDTLLKALLEAVRINYIIPILWRRVAQDTIVGQGSKKLKVLEQGRILAISNQAAMLDGKRISNPKTFDINRSPDIYMVYGHNFHYCVGSKISNAILLELFKALLVRDPKRSGRNRKIRWVGMYPWNLYIEYRSDS